MWTLDIQFNRARTPSLSAMEAVCNTRRTRPSTPLWGPRGWAAIDDNRPMTASLPQSSSRRGALLLADISGYTGFLQGVADAHRALIIEADEPPQAYALLSQLLDTMHESIVP